MKARSLKLLCGGLTVAVAGGAYAAYASVKKPTVKVVTRTVTASTGDVTEKISSTGTVQAASTVNLAFSGSGKLISLPVAVGATVKKGDVIGSIDPTSAQNALATAKANLVSAQSKYDTTVAGLTSDERAQITLSTEQAQAQVESARRSQSDTAANLAQAAIGYQSSIDAAQTALDNAHQTADFGAKNYQASVDAAQTALDNAKANLSYSAATYQTSVDSAQAALDNTKATAALSAKTYQSTVDQAQTAIDNAKTSAAFNATASANSVASAALAITGTGQNGLALQNAQNNAAQSAAKDAQSIAAAETSYQNALTTQTANLAKDAQSIKSAETALANAKASQAASLTKDAQQITSLQTALANALTSQTTSLAKDAQSIKSAETALANARTNMQTSLLKDSQTRAAAVVSVKNAELSLKSTKLGNAVKLAPAKQADVLAAQTAIDSAKTGVESAQDNVDATTLTSSIDGTITTLANAVGETVAQGTFATVTSTGDLSVKVGFSEANSAKLKVGQRATITFDALPDVTISSVITGVDATATSVQNVATYYATMSIPGAAAKGVKPGMTASAEVVVNERTGVVVLPSSALTTIGGRAVVNIRKGTVDTRTPVETGLVGSEGTEIVSGLSDGDVIVVPSATGSSAAGLTAAARTAVAGGALSGGGVAVPAGGPR